MGYQCWCCDLSEKYREFVDCMKLRKKLFYGQNILKNYFKVEKKDE